MVEATTVYSNDIGGGARHDSQQQQDNKISLSAYHPTTMMTEMRSTPLNIPQQSLEYFITDMRQTIANQVGPQQCIVLSAIDRKRKYPDNPTNNVNIIENITEENDYKQKYFDLLGRYENLKTKYSILTKEHDLCKRTVPVPPPETEQWLRTVLAKVELLKEGGGPTGKIPLSPHSLRSCVRDTPSNTARQIVRRLFSKEDLATMSASKIDNELMNDIIAFVRSKHPLHPIETSKIKAAISNLCVQARRELKGPSSSQTQHVQNNDKNNTTTIIDTSNQQNNNNNNNTSYSTLTDTSTTTAITTTPQTVTVKYE
ncbi:unnamed protein product [Didymodactylos carnosus]|uniref:BEN domain-containing protein n=1 Tax=Didymodactylos carnosus TaxID=1234261 RepID=A0A814CUL5_9BILA|nr:unnamed protein product [Didymodactylos carnosus]CAF0946977.1 unnamed protein product [Didymodactylos carnosus]CAF3720810.1 unnamed protein product [Didymodactylos carnosus]CAF3723079.1 unnamed protein product [Didymodactylos carnosus]